MIAMPTISPNQLPGPEAKPGFWRRQFAAKLTTPRILFDVTFGAVAPILCFVFDPIVFRGGLGGAPLFADYQAVVYLFSGAEILLLFLWLVLDPGFEFCNSLIGGALFFGGLFCMAIGLVLLPYSAFGLIIGIGLFGFVPFGVGFVYLRQGYRALRATSTKLSVKTLTALSGILLVIAMSVLPAIEIRAVTTDAVNQILKGDSEEALSAAHRLAPLKFVSEAQMDRLVNAYTSEQDESRKQLLKRCYWEATGENIEQRIVARD